MKFWKKLSPQVCNDYIDNALSENIDFSSRLSLGIPASKLDSKVFYDQATFLKEAPLLRAVVQNPNHIGCHTIQDSEVFFSGTQKIEKELIDIVSVDIMGAEPNAVDGYVASGGTEANLQAAWMYRNYFMANFNAALHEIALFASEDTHYSIVKAANLLALNRYEIPVDLETRKINVEKLQEIVSSAAQSGIKYCIIFCNMGTTMFGSIDNPDDYVTVMQQNDMNFKIHLDAAFGGFIYPIISNDYSNTLRHPFIDSVTLDAHKMLQAPYGTGIFLAKKGLMQYVMTKEASYVNGMDITLCGSRSGANAIAVWMILGAYGPHGWYEKLNTLMYRTSWACKQLDNLGIKYYRHPNMNIITIRANFVSMELVVKYGLVPDTHNGEPNYFKIVVMEHVEVEALQAFFDELSNYNEI